MVRSQPRTSRAWLAALALPLAACGYVGGPNLPLANVPAQVGDLVTVQRGAVIMVHFSVPLRTTENILIQKPLKLDLRIGTYQGDPVEPGIWAEHATKIPEVKIADAAASAEIPSAAWT